MDTQDLKAKYQTPRDSAIQSTSPWPARSIRLPQSQTQIKSFLAAASAPANIGLAANRRKDLLDLGESVSQVPPEFFTDPNGVLPPLKKGINIGSVIERLKQGNNIHKGRWSVAPGDPHQHYNSEREVFEDVEQIIEAIQEASGIHDTPTLVFECNPDMSSDSSTRPDNRVKSDAYGILAHVEPEDGRLTRWIDVAVPGEFKNSTSNDQDVDVGL